MTLDWANNKAKQAYDGFVPSGEQYGFEGPGLQGGVLLVLEEQQIPTGTTATSNTKLTQGTM